jgi:hypothetical protein
MGHPHRWHEESSIQTLLAARKLAPQDDVFVGVLTKKHARQVRAYGLRPCVFGPCLYLAPIVSHRDGHMGGSARSATLWIPRLTAQTSLGHY